MWRKLSLCVMVLLLCCALGGLDALEANGSSAAPATERMMLLLAAEEEDARTGKGRSPTAAPLEDEQDNQENIISQLLGDYDKVKTVSSGSDCVCRCVVRPIKRSDCDPASPSRESYTVETITKGTDCKQCLCMAPPSAVNPCEGEYRFKKLQEASRDDIKLATIIDLLEGSMYGLDLLKLQSVTTKLLTRMDNMEKAFTRNLTERTREKERAKEKAKDKEKKAQQKKKKTNELDCGGAKSGAAAFAHKQNQLKKNQQGDGTEHQPVKNKTAVQTVNKEKPEARQPIKDRSSLVIRGVTFYKAEEEEETKGRGRNIVPTTTRSSVDPLTSGQLPPARRPEPVTEEPAYKELPKTTSQPTTSQQTTTAPPPSTIKPTPELPTTTSPAPTTTELTTTSRPTTATTTTTTTTVQPATAAGAGPPTEAAPQPKPRSRLSWTESPADQPKPSKKPGLCKDTVASISEPVQRNSYGLSDGAWMRDARGHGSVVYLTDGHYGNSLLEFRDQDAFKSGQASNSYKLPYSFTGTGHVVFDGAFYYNRAFSRDVIRYDLRHRFVAAWTTLHDALLEEQAHRAQTEVELAVDESGLWLLYPALDAEGFHQEVILLVHLHPRDLQTVRTFRTGLRRGRYGNAFLVCGVLYAVDSMERRYANVTYAFDTHTLTHTVPSLAFTNAHGHTSQLSYCPLDKKLYAWDDGHQMTYDVIFAY